MSPIRAVIMGVVIVFYLMFTSMVVYGQGGYPPENDPYINDYAGVIKPEDAEKIRELLIDLKQQSDIDMAVLTIDSIHDYQTGDATVSAFATNLFNAWGIGDGATNMGVLILVAVQDREVRIELGSGYGSKYNAAMQSVIDKQMLPNFKEAQYSRGILLGVRATISELTGTPSSTNQSSVTPIPKPTQKMASSVPRPVNTKSGNVTNGWSILLVAVGGGAIYFGVSRYLRFRKRKCTNCGATMIRLDEVSDDVYLDSGQKIEEKLGSVDYDVWKCSNCGMHALHGYRSLLSIYKRCHQCGRTTLEVTKTTIEHATEYSTGRERITKRCRHCKYRDVDIVVLPMLTRSENNDSSFRSNSFDSDSKGSSSGSGASGKW